MGSSSKTPFVVPICPTFVRRQDDIGFWAVQALGKAKDPNPVMQVKRIAEIDTLN